MRLPSIAFALLSLSACTKEPAHSDAATPPTHSTEAHTFKTTLGKNHALVGKFFDGATFQEVSESDVVEASASADYVLLGEKHDNPDHHIEQARILSQLAIRRHNPPPAVVFEMIETDMKTELDAFLASPKLSAAGFGDALTWEKRGWGPWANYQPIVDVAFENKLKIVAGGLPLTRAMDLAHHAEGAMNTEDLKTLLLDEDMPKPLEASLEDELMKAHCGHLPASMARGMSLAERARDSQMAIALAQDPIAVLIAGNGHTRTDRGVPYALAKIAPKAKVVSVSMIEVDDAHKDPSTYDIHANYIFFTPRVSNEDPCQKFREELLKKKRELNRP
jgi:uncharacterized iron-regulated protein